MTVPEAPAGDTLLLLVDQEGVDLPDTLSKRFYCGSVYGISYGSQ